MFMGAFFNCSAPRRNDVATYSISYDLDGAIAVCTLAE
jgi:hypothetical protein